MKLPIIPLLTCFLLSAFSFQLSEAATITSKTEKTTLAGTEEIPLNDSGTDKKALISTVWKAQILSGGWTASGSAAWDLSGSTGTFLTPTGAHTFGGSANTFAASITPATNDVGALGSASLSWADLFIASGGVINFANGNWVATHTSGILTVGTGDLRVTTAGTNTASVVTVGGAQSLSSKTLISPVISTGMTASGSAANDLSGSTGTFLSPTGANTLGGAVTINDATTPSLTTATGKTNTGFLTVNGKTSGAFKITTADATAQTVTLTLAAQTSGAGALGVADMQGVAGTVAVEQASLAVSLTADNQAVTPGPRRVIQLSSDNATDTNRTFTLSATGAVTGAVYVLIGPASNACEIADTGIQVLSATWSPAAGDTLTLLFDGTNFTEIARSNN